jgi:hypothetical protein
MSPQKQDYLLRLLEELGQFVAEITRLRNGGSHDAALLTVLQAQERLFARPAQEFIARPVEEQVALLVIAETATPGCSPKPESPIRPRTSRRWRSAPTATR